MEKTLALTPALSPGRGRAAFTLAEVLAAMVFMAVLVPIALEGLSVASELAETHIEALPRLAGPHGIFDVQQIFIQRSERLPLSLNHQGKRLETCHY